MPVRYAAPAGALHWRRWDDEMVVFDGASARTHLLAPAAAEVLHTLLHSPVALDAAALAQQLLGGDDGEPPHEDDVRALQALLQELARLGLVSPAP